MIANDPIFILLHESDYPIDGEQVTSLPALILLPNDLVDICPIFFGACHSKYPAFGQSHKLIVSEFIPRTVPQRQGFLFHMKVDTSVHEVNLRDNALAHPGVFQCFRFHDLFSDWLVLLGRCYLLDFGQ